MVECEWFCCIGWSFIWSLIGMVYEKCFDIFKKFWCMFWCLGSKKVRIVLVKFWRIKEFLFNVEEFDAKMWEKICAKFKMDANCKFWIMISFLSALLRSVSYIYNDKNVQKSRIYITRIVLIPHSYFSIYILILSYNCHQIKYFNSDPRIEVVLQLFSLLLFVQSS